MTDKNVSAALRRLEYGVYVVTMGKGNAGNAFTASWVTQVSSAPPMIALAVHNKHQSSQLLQEKGAFVLNIIDKDQVAVAKTYYGPAESGYEKLKHASLKVSPVTGTAMLDGATGYLDCRIVKMVPAGNHTLVLADVVAGEADGERPILTTTSSRLHYAG
ncbi:flavin reductase [candidate division GN15 bacterium]|uniref:Flavin reductase n=1 Tax=candidate division GN15 bacterium TaxID=2072418 RepID=A0A855X3L8_9BACT|nr:MAG: flavin reductase [candidate division GN15 bacterium]